jgi:hypothetical protein
VSFSFSFGHLVPFLIAQSLFSNGSVSVSQVTSSSLPSFMEIIRIPMLEGGLSFTLIALVLPFAVYVLFLVAYLIVDLIRSIVSLPGVIAGQQNKQQP